MSAVGNGDRARQKDRFMRARCGNGGVELPVREDPAFFGKNQSLTRKRSCVGDADREVCRRSAGGIRHILPFHADSEQRELSGQETCRGDAGEERRRKSRSESDIDIRHAETGGCRKQKKDAVRRRKRNHCTSVSSFSSRMDSMMLLSTFSTDFHSACARSFR